MTTSSEETALAITYADIEAAAARLEGQAHRTPVMTSRSFNADAGVATWFKCEQFQRAGAFKFRGAYNKIASLPAAERERGVIAFSSGNHAQAVSIVARLFGVPAVICMPHRCAGGQSGGDARLRRRDRPLRPPDRGPRGTGTAAGR